MIGSVNSYKLNLKGEELDNIRREGREGERGEGERGRGGGLLDNLEIDIFY